WRVHGGGHAPRLPPQPPLDAALLDLLRADVPGARPPLTWRAVPVPGGPVRPGVPRRAVARAVQGPRADVRADRSVLEARRPRLPRSLPPLRVDAADAHGGLVRPPDAAVHGATVPRGIDRGARDAPHAAELPEDVV